MPDEGVAPWFFGQLVAVAIWLPVMFKFVSLLISKSCHFIRSLISWSSNFVLDGIKSGVEASDSATPGPLPGDLPPVHNERD